MKKYLILCFILAFASLVSAAPKAGLDTLMIETTYVNDKGVEVTELVKTVRLVTQDRSGQNTRYYAVDPHIEQRVRSRRFPALTKS